MLRPLVHFGIALLLALGAHIAPAADRPNIVFIMADDLGYGDLGCFGQKHIQTPNIDRLAREGMRFTHCYAGSPVCAPSRSVLMTGQHTGRTRVRGNFGKAGGVKGLGGGSGRVPLKNADVTVAELLKGAGYATGMVGKWGLGEPGTTGEPNLQGFDHWFGYLNQRRAHSYYPEFLWLNQQRFPLDGNKGGERNQYAHDLLTESALGFLDARIEEPETPFFLYLPYTIPHAKLEVPDLAPYTDEDWKPHEKAYAAMVTRMDRDIGRLLARLDVAGIADDTVVFFCSDNGAADRYDRRFDSSGVLRGRKRDLYEGGIRTPMVVRWPGKIAAGSTSELPWTFADFLPTSVELSCGQLPTNFILDGRSIAPTLRGRKQPALHHRFLYWEFFERGFQQAARWKQWKVIRFTKGKPLQLYNLATDPGEKSDLAKEHPDLVATFETFLQTARTESVSWPVDR